MLNVMDFVSPRSSAASLPPAETERGDILFCSGGSNLSLAAHVGEFDRTIYCPLTIYFTVAFALALLVL